MEKTLEEKILEDLLKTGYINELEVARKLSQYNWKPNLNGTYLDKDLNINREIDVTASKRGGVKYDKVNIRVELIIECKKTSNPWVIVSNNDERSIHFHLAPGWTIIHGGEKYINNGGIFPPRLIDEHFMRCNSSRIGSAFHDAFKEPKEISKIFQAIMNASKAAISRSSIYGASPEWKDYKKEAPTNLTFFHPIVVVDGPLFEAYLNLSNKLEVKQIDWIPTTYRYSSPNYSKDSDILFHCDIVTFNYFERYIELVDNWLIKMNEACVEYYKKHYA